MAIQIDEKQQRIDYIIPTLNEKETWMEDNFKETPEGYLSGRAIITNIGVFPYLQEDGSVRWELRPPKEVNDQESLMSLRNSILTNDHPNEAVTIDTQEKYNVGFVGDAVRVDGIHVSDTITITKKEAKNDVINGKRALSAGYFADIEFTSGVWLGIPYDAIQRNIRYNHVAIVDKGRAGDAVTMKLDKADNDKLALMCNLSNDAHKTNFKQEDFMSKVLKKINLDGVDYEAEAEVIKTITGLKNDLSESGKKVEELQGDLKTLKSDKDKMEADRDSEKERADKAEKDLQELKDSAPNQEEINTMIEERLSLIQNAEKAKIDVKETMTNLEIKKAVIKSVCENINLDEKSEDYIEARYDGVVEGFKEKDIHEDKGTLLNNSHLKEDVSDSKTAHDKYIEELKSRSQRKE